ncbi:MAG: hypothetical protein KatS3mg101_0049 [Patescibacteria group bacterium]|nr:MAG: hypothetical protein KatS3mg101_0049 [Patescibacteria group bacterium]
MKKNLDRNLFLELWFAVTPLLICVFLSFRAFALDMENPTLSDIGVVLIRIMNWAVFLVGIVLVFYIVYGAAKASMALGDPRGLESAKSTWTYALYGALIVIAFFGIFTIVAGFFGIRIGMDSIFQEIVEGISAFITVALPPPSQ